MTLPFISYGGSALLSTAMTMGFLLVLTRRTAEPRISLSARQPTLADA
jgi:cell division protein FtsW